MEGYKMVFLKLAISALGIIAALAVVITIVFLAYRAMVTNKLRREHRITSVQGIDEELILEVGGIRQYLYIRGQNIENPIILFLHGGPGGTMIPMLHTYQYLWENAYTVVNWDQRGTGKTYFLNKDDSRNILLNLSADVLLKDTHEIVLYLTERFGKKNVIISGHSWGTILGAQYVLAHPEYVGAYVAVAQAVDVNDGILKMGEYTHRLAAAEKDEKDVAALEQIMERVRKSKTVAESETLAICKIAKRYIPVNMDTTIFFRNGLFSPYFSLRELSYYAKMDELTKPLNEYVADYDLREIGTRYAVPVIYIFGEYDWHMKLLAKEYYDKVTCPYKKFISIAGAGHVAMMDKPHEFFEAFHSTLQELYPS